MKSKRRSSLYLLEGFWYFSFKSWKNEGALCLFQLQHIRLTVQKSVSMLRIYACVRIQKPVFAKFIRGNTEWCHYPCCLPRTKDSVIFTLHCTMYKQVPPELWISNRKISNLFVIQQSKISRLWCMRCFTVKDQLRIWMNSQCQLRNNRFVGQDHNCKQLVCENCTVSIQLVCKGFK